MKMMMQATPERDDANSYPPAVEFELVGDTINIRLSGPDRLLSFSFGDVWAIVRTMKTLRDADS